MSAVLTPPDTEQPTHHAAPPRTASSARVARRPTSTLTRVGAVLSLFALLLLGFAVYLFGLSGIQERRTQETLYKTLRSELMRAVAPTGPTTPGDPVAILNIPAVGLHDVVVVEGTSAASLTRGPGHRMDTPLPGQAGVSVIYGRRVTFGAPFADLTRLRAGDRIITTSGQGTFAYRVNTVGTADHPVSDTFANRLVLSTADSTGAPSSTITVSARLVGNQLMPPAAAYPVLPPTQVGLTTSTDSLLPLMLWSMALVGAVTVGTIAVQRWARWPAYLAVLPVVLAIVWNVYENAAQLLPNLY